MPRSLPPSVTPDAIAQFRREIEILLGQKVDLRVNNNSSSVLQVRHPRGKSSILSVHHMFLRGGNEITRALAQYLRRPTPTANRTLRQYINAHTHELTPRAASPQKLRLRARGRTHDLHTLAEAINQQFFGGRVQIKVTWGRGTVRKGHRRHMIFGSYSHSTHLIRIHPALDDPSVPEWFVKFVLYHEMLHAVIDPEHDADGRRYVHTREFRNREREHPDYARAKVWEKAFMMGQVLPG
ncbi:MAG: SprT-like domain-containing protein [Candidatus Sumerlaeaceae bacterium]|nr:SprT-like domain-containing protein [Candidatus Sumerlaeaceae bacterium]